MNLIELPFNVKLTELLYHIYLLTDCCEDKMGGRRTFHATLRPFEEKWGVSVMNTNFGWAVFQSEFELPLI